MHAVLVAGGIPALGDRLYPYSNGSPKALIEVAGKPMAQWVIDALEASHEIERVVLVGLSESAGLRSAKPLLFVEDRHGLLANSQAGLARVRQLDPRADRVLISGADIPSVRPEILDWRVRSASPEADIDYVAIERSVMEARFPGSNRSYVRLRGLQVCGGDANVVRVDLATDDRLWNRLLEARKSAWRQAQLLGWDLVFLLITRLLSLAEAERRVSRRLGIRAHAHLCPHAELGMDIDKPHQLELLRQDLGGE
jgi:molybdopterin-guanine dinucleotide biosynthesis protein A